jgi:methyl-accepting chemotaxis protein
MITLDMKILGLFIGIIFLIVVGTLLTIALLKFIKLLNKVNGILDNNTKNINNTLQALPEMTENLNEAAITAKRAFGSMNEITDNVNGIVATAAEAEETVGSFANVVAIITNVAGFIAGLFNKQEL